MESYREGKKMFKVGTKSFEQIKLTQPEPKTYRMLPEHDGRPWQTYVGDDRFIGGLNVLPISITHPNNEGDRFVFTVGPWWIDPNHSDPGFGTICLVMTAGTALGELESGFQLLSDLLYPQIDQMVIQGQVQGYNVKPKGAELFFWFQAYSAAIDRFLNYACVGQPLTQYFVDGDKKTFQLKLDVSNGDDWVCLGSCDLKDDRYGMVPLNSADIDVVFQVGFIWAPVDFQPVWPEKAIIPNLHNLGFGRCWPVDIEKVPTGVLAFYDLKIDYMATHKILEY